MVKSSQRNALIEKYRYINVEYTDWYEPVVESFKDDMRAVGIEVYRVYFSGFCSQGDGACFVGSLGDTRKYLDHHHADQFPMVRKLLEQGGDVHVTTSHRGNYYHQYSVTLNVESDTFWSCMEARSELQEAVIERWDEALTKEMSDFETALTEQWRTYMQDVYRKLEEEYDHLTSDEAVWDTIEANELVEDVDDDEDDYDRAA